MTRSADFPRTPPTSAPIAICTRTRAWCPGSYYDSGFEVQAAYVFAQHFEPFIRYEWTHLDDISLVRKSLLNSDLVQQFTLGANYYIYGQNMKLTLEGSWLPSGSPADARMR